MLVLSRQRDEMIMIGDDIEITIVDIRGEKVRLGINAPPHIPVHRKEVYEAMKREKVGAHGEGKPGQVQSLAKRKKPVEPPSQGPPQESPPPPAGPKDQT
jgi:carbon storage regulator